MVLFEMQLQHSLVHMQDKSIKCMKWWKENNLLMFTWLM